MRTLYVIAPVLVAGSFFAGASSARHRAPMTPAPIALAPPAPATVPAARVAAPPRPGPHAPRFVPPPLPANDPGVAELVNAPRDPSPELLQARAEETDHRLDELFGPQFPVAKREAVRAAQATWMREHQHAVQDYYKGEIDRGELTVRVHQNMLVWAARIQAALSPDEYRRYTDLEPGADPYVVLVPPGAQIGEAPPVAP